MSCRPTGSYPGKGLRGMRRAHGFRVATEVKSVSPRYRFVIALHSPEINRRNRTADVPCGEKPGHCPLFSRAVRSLQSGLFGNYRGKWASFAYFEPRDGGLSLQLRLAGGEGGIRRSQCTFEMNSVPQRLRRGNPKKYVPDEGTRSQENSAFQRIIF
jgi:hypothetical protein